MLKRVGFIGVGHLAEYLITGLNRTGVDFEFFMADPLPERAQKLAATVGGRVSTDNQTAVDNGDLIILATRPEQVRAALNGLTFTRDKILASAAAGVTLDSLRPYTGPARLVRVLPISCVAINQSPTVIYPGDREVLEFFSLLGNVHPVPDEEAFIPATSLVGAFYAWVFALMDEAAGWTVARGIDPVLARKLVVETVQGACGMAGAQGKLTLREIWDTLATPGGISEHGLRVINDKGCLKAWSEALESVTQKILQK